MTTIATGPVTTERASLLVVEAGFTLLVIALALFWPRLGANQFAAIERGLGRLARRRALSVAVTGVAALCIRLLILPLSPIPQPFVHDEFANLLAADTFASARITNPTHAMWVYFESFHITHLPTYMSMYFPAAGLVLAAGKILAGNPWFGICFCAALMCSAICWMLQGWLPPGWALLGGMLAVVRLALFSYWTDSYYGGAVAAIGGALVVGALPRIRRRARVRDGLWLALGVAILANSRPYEGTLLCVPVGCALLWWAATKAKFPAVLLLRRALLPVALLLAVAALDGYYNYRVFGSPFTLPYQVNRATYASAPVFIWQQPRPEPVYRYKEMRDFYSRAELALFLTARTPAGFLRGSVKKAGIVVFFFCGFALLPPLVLLPRVLRDRRLRFLLIAGTVTVAGLCANAWLFPHYLAPFTAGIYAILLQAMRHLRARRRSGAENRGLALVRAIPVACLMLAGLRLFAAPLNLAIPRWPAMWYGTEPLGIPRARVLAALEAIPGRQLAIVRYSPRHEPFDDWVYNAADIDKSAVVWARETADHDAALLQYFPTRNVWLVEPDSDPPMISPYPGQ